MGKAIRDSGVPREELFVATKLISTDHANPSAALSKSLSKLGLDYVDLYLIHWPQAAEGEGWPLNAKTLQPDEYPTINDTWAGMEQVFESGKAKAIGVSNFSVKTLQGLAATQKVVPAVNQVEIHPFLPQSELKEYCNAKGIHLTAYSSLGTSSRTKVDGLRLTKTHRVGQPIEGQDVPSLLNNDLITEIAKKYGASTGQILVSWGVQRGTSVLAKSEKEERLRTNITVSTRSLSLCRV